MAAWTRRRRAVEPRISTLNDVVSDVRADPAADQAAAARPTMKSTPTGAGIDSWQATIENSSSLLAGISRPGVASTKSIMTVPRIRNRAMTKNCITPLTIMFLRYERLSRQARLRCIMS